MLQTHCLKLELRWELKYLYFSEFSAFSFIFYIMFFTVAFQIVWSAYASVLRLRPLLLTFLSWTCVSFMGAETGNEDFLTLRLPLSLTVEIRNIMIRIWTLFILILFNIQLCCNYVLYTNIRQSLNLLEVNFWFVFWFFLQIIEMTESSLSVEDAQEESLQCATSQTTPTCCKNTIF